MSSSNNRNTFDAQGTTTTTQSSSTATNLYGEAFYNALADEDLHSFKLQKDGELELKNYFGESATPSLTAAMLTILVSACINPFGTLFSDSLDAQAFYALIGAIPSHVEYSDLQYIIRILTETVRIAVTTFRSSNPNFTVEEYEQGCVKSQSWDMNVGFDYEVIRGKSQGVLILVRNACRILKELVEKRFGDLQGLNQLNNIRIFLAFLESEKDEKQFIKQYLARDKLSEALGVYCNREERVKRGYQVLHPSAQ